MSGGSYNYLCFADADEILNKLGVLEEMSDRLAGLGYADDAAEETQMLALQIRHIRNRLNASVKRLKSVWRAVEWWDSSDSSEDGVKAALEKYRQEITPTSSPEQKHPDSDST